MPKKQKFTDEQFLELYNLGFNDHEISHKLNVSNTSVEKRRWKHNLLPNYRITIITIMNPKQHLQERYKKEYFNGTEKRLLWEKENREQRKIYMLQWKQDHPEVHRKYVQEHRKELAKRERQYYQRHKEQIRKRAHEKYQRQKEQINQRAKEKRQQKKKDGRTALSFSLEKQTTTP